ncbi:formin-binding protein 1-like isoform X2 [Panonychus citri]|uniref:formin-binding protein 1-like isoform X2 n=1 Tax=Panonychus citri TaxID=50023 RepID=UPI0023077D69|nr:formin-binding protein 1-like isoform X2 [Panonychus citri]
MSWGVELWDQYENISCHTHKGIEFLDKFGSFVKERCAIETEYASKLRRLVKNHQFKKKDEEDQQFSYLKAFMMMLQEITDLAGQHEVIAENMMGVIVKQIALLVKEMKEERKRILNEGQKHQTTLAGSLAQLDKAKKSYEKAYREAEKAQENFLRVDADLNLSRAEVEKAKLSSTAKSQMCEESKTEYAKYLQLANEHQRLHYNELLPMVFQRFQAMEERRIACIKDFIRETAVIQQKVTPIINKCLEGIIIASETIDGRNDCVLVIERYKSGMEPPDDIPFEDLNNPRPLSDNISNHSSNYHHISMRPETIRHGKDTLNLKIRKRVGLFNLFGSNKDDYAELPPVQRRKRLTEKIDSIKSQIVQETNVRDGLMKMKHVYEQNHNFGDATTLEDKLSESSQKMDKLQNELRKFEGYLSEFNQNGTSRMAERSPSNVRKPKASSISEDSLSRSASDSSVSQKQEISPIHDNHNSMNDSNSNLNTSSINSTLNNMEITRDNGLTSAAPSSTPTHYNNHNSNNKDATNHIDTYEAIDSSLSDKNDTTDSGNNDHNIAQYDETVSSNGPNEEIDGNSYNYPAAEFIDEDDDFEPALLPPIGRAQALYGFEAQSEGSIPMGEGEIFEVVELDQGDGWTRVRRINDQEEGFVPTSYLKCDLYK